MRFLLVLASCLALCCGRIHSAPTITAATVKSLRAPRDVTDLAFSPDSKLLASGSRGHVTVWADKGEVVLDESIRDMPGVEKNDDPLRAPMNNEPAVRRVLFGPDSKLLAVACVDSDVRVYDVPNTKLLYSVYGNGRGGANCMAFSHDGKLLAAGGHDKLVAIYNAATGKMVRKLEGHTYNVVAVAFTADDKQVVSVGCQNMGRDNTEVRFTNASTGELLDNRTLSGLLPDCLALSQDGKTLFAAFIDMRAGGMAGLHLWNTGTGERTPALSGFSFSLGPIPRSLLRLLPESLQGVMR